MSFIGKTSAFLRVCVLFAAIFAATQGSGATAVEETARIWTNREGHTVRGRLDDEGGTLTLIRAGDNRRFTITLDMLCDADRRHVLARREKRTAANRASGAMEIFPLVNPVSQYQQGITEELETLLERYGIRTGIAAPTEMFVLFRNVNFLEPLRQAEAKLGLSMGSRAEVITPGFNPSSFYFHTYNIPDDSPLRPFSNILLVVDRAGNVVAVQLHGGSATAVPYQNSGFNQIRIIDSRRKAAANARVYWDFGANDLRMAALASQHGPEAAQPHRSQVTLSGENRSDKGGSVIIMRSSFYSSRNKPLNGYKLHLPAHLGSLILENLQTIRKAATGSAR